MELENIVANTVYLKAREGGPENSKGRSKKWRKLMAFPHISTCLQIQSSLPSLTYDFIVDQQPLGQKLFQQFCIKHKKEYYHYNEFIDCVESYELELEDSRVTSAQTIVRKFLTRPATSDSGVDTCEDTQEAEKFIDALKDETIGAVIQNVESGQRDLFCTCVAEVKSYLSKAPFDEFKQSMYFFRYLQWKKLEMAPITYKTFRMYRVLGKGGFGEVCACQTRATGKMYACKKLEKKRVKKRKGESMVLSEKLILQKINSQFVVNLAYAFETKDSLCLVLTIMTGGDLKFHVSQMKYPLPYCPFHFISAQFLRVQRLSFKLKLQVT